MTNDPQHLAESRFGIRNGRIFTLLFTLSILFPSLTSHAQIPEAPAEIPASVMEFENSPFFKNHECTLEKIEPLRYRGAIECWFYNYVHYRNESSPPTQFGMRLTNDGNRDSPYMILRWFPVTKIDDIDFAIIKDYLSDIIGKPAQRVIPFIRDFAKARLSNKNRKQGAVTNSPEMKIENLSFSCTYTQGTPPRYPQLTLIVTSD